jgi:hypothetical protein
MKHVFLLALANLMTISISAQSIPPVSNPVCAYCGVNLPSGEKHKQSCRYYEKKQSTKLKDYTPMTEVSSKYSQADLKRLYGYGNGLKCPHCGGVSGHVGSDCVIKYSQNRAKELRQEAEMANDEKVRKRILFQYHTMEDNINTLAKAGTQTQVTQLQQENNNTPSSSSYTNIVSPNVYVLKNYDKKLSYGSGYATAFGATMPNGTERWLLTDPEGNEVGMFSKIEFAEVNGTKQFILVRNDNGQWGIYSNKGILVCEPRYESVKLLTTPLGSASENTFFDVTKRDDSGVLKHGLYSSVCAPEVRQGENIPCQCDQIELIDRCPVSLGVLAKVMVEGKAAVLNASNGNVVIQPVYSYVNTYFTRKRGMYFIIGDTNGLGACHAESMEEVVPVTNGFTLDKVRNLIDERDR